MRTAGILILILADFNFSIYLGILLIFKFYQKLFIHNQWKNNTNTAFLSPNFRSLWFIFIYLFIFIPSSEINVLHSRNSIKLFL